MKETRKFGIKNGNYERGDWWLCGKVLRRLWVFPAGVPVWLTGSDQPISGAVKLEFRNKEGDRNGQWRHANTPWRRNWAHVTCSALVTWMMRTFKARESVTLWVYLEYEV